MNGQPLTMSHRELWEALGISKRKFTELKRVGLFDRLESPIPFKYSREKVEAFVAGRSVHARGWKAAS